jgi:uroporphyrinogen-III synthase
LPEANLAGCMVACIGPSTEATARELGIPVSVVAREHTVAGLMEALVGMLLRPTSGNTPGCLSTDQAG